MGKQNRTFIMSKLFTAAIIVLVCTTVQSLESSRYSVKRVQRLAKIPAVKLHGEVIPRTRLNTTRTGAHTKKADDAKLEQDDEGTTINSTSKSNKTNTVLHLPKTSTNQLKLRIGALSKVKPGSRTFTPSSKLASESSSDVTTELPIATTEVSKGSNTGNKHLALPTATKLEIKPKSSNLPTRNRHIDEKKMSLKRLVADSSQIVSRKLNFPVKTTLQPTEVTEISNDTTNVPQDSTIHYETTTILTPTTDTKRNSTGNHINDKVKNVRITTPLVTEKRTASPRTIIKHTIKMNISTSSQLSVTTEKIPDINKSAVSIKDASRTHARSRHVSSDLPKTTIVNHHVTKIPGSLSSEKSVEHGTSGFQETSKTTTETSISSHGPKDSSRKRYGQRNRGKVTSVPQDISSPLHDLAISESDLKKTYKTAPTERPTTREFKNRPAKFGSHSPVKFKPHGLENQSPELKIKTNTVKPEVTQPTTELITDVTDDTTISVTEVLTTLQRGLSREKDTNRRTAGGETSGINKVTNQTTKLTRGTTEIPEKRKFTHVTTNLTGISSGSTTESAETSAVRNITTEQTISSSTTATKEITTSTQYANEPIEVPTSTHRTTVQRESHRSTYSTDESPDRTTHRSRGRRGRIVKVVKVMTTPSVPTIGENMTEFTTYPTTLTETNPNTHELILETSTPGITPKRAQRPIKKHTTDNEVLTTETPTDFTTLPTTTLSNKSIQESEEKVSHNGRRRGHRVVKMVRKVPIETDSKLQEDRYANENEKEIILTSETVYFDSPRRVKKVIKVNRKNMSNTESTTKIPATTLVDSVTMTTKTDEVMIDSMESTYQDIDTSTSLPQQETTITNDVFETTVSNNQNHEDTSSRSEEFVTEKYNRGRGRSRKRILPDEIPSSTTEAILETSKISDYDTDYDEVQEDYVGSYSRNVDATVYLSSGEEKKHEQIQKRAADEDLYNPPPSTSSIVDPTRSQRFVSGSDSSRNSRTKKVYQRRLPSEYQTAANKYRTKYLSKFPGNNEQGRDKSLNKTLQNNFKIALLKNKKEERNYPIKSIELMDDVVEETSENNEETTLSSISTQARNITTLKSKLETETSKRLGSLLNLQNDALNISSSEKKTTLAKEIVITTVQKSYSTERTSSTAIPTNRFITEDPSPLKISLNYQFTPPSEAVKKVVFTNTNLVVPSTAQKIFSTAFKTTLPLVELEKNRFSTSTKTLPSSSTEPPLKSSSKFIRSTTVSTVSTDVYKKNDFPTPRKQVVAVAVTKSVSQGSPKELEYAKTIVPEKSKHENEKAPTFTEALTNRAYQVLAAVQQMAGVVIDLPKQLLLLPVRLGFYPGTERKQREIAKSVEFPCKHQQRDDGVPTSVHRLRPGDIKVVAALGDSFTTANAALAENEDEARNNYRGVSAMGGGQATWRQYLTLPNILREFNPRLLGYALGTVESTDPISGLNVAENGALDDQIVQQAQFLVAKMRNNHFIDFNSDWKLVNILIGSNDICKEYCFQHNDKDSPLGHLRQLEEALLYLKKNLPRTFVNLIHIPNLVTLKEMKNTPFTCHMKQLVECTCLFGNSKKTTVESVTKMLHGYWEAERRVAEDERFDTEDFTVVLQPFFQGVTATGTVSTLLGDVTDLSFFAPDCFHFSQKGNARIANALWNNMLEPVGKKTLGWELPMKKFICPSDRTPYLFTRRNSQTFFQTGHQ